MDVSFAGGLIWRDVIFQLDVISQVLTQSLNNVWMDNPGVWSTDKHDKSTGVGGGGGGGGRGGGEDTM